MTSHLYQVQNMFKSWRQKKAFGPQIGLFSETCKEEESYCYYARGARGERGVLREQEMSTCKKMKLYMPKSLFVLFCNL
jgi:hypothetical protein